MREAIHPDSIIKESLVLIEKVGSRDFLRSPRHKKEKEKFIAGLFTYAIRKYSEREWFIDQLPEPASSDFMLTACFDRLIKEKPFEPTFSINTNDSLIIESGCI